MKKFLILLALLYPASALAQYAVYSEPITNQLGQPLVGATVAVCSGSSMPTLVVPCVGSSLATLASSFTGGAQINPLYTDVNGRAGIYALPGNYYLQVYGTGLQTTIIPVSIGGSGGGGSGNVTAIGTPVANELAIWTGPTTIEGILGLTSDPSGNLGANSITLGAGSGACGSATGCLSAPTSSGSTTPASGQNSLRFGASNLLCSINGGAEVPCAGNPLPSAQIGDIARYNVNGDSSWDSANAAGRIGVVFFDAGTGILGDIGSGNTPTALGSISLVNPTYSDSAGGSYASTSSASTNTVIGASWQANGNYGAFGIGSFYRWSFRFAAGQTTNARYWMGLGVFFVGGTGNNGANLTGSTAYATDTPTKSTVGFRYSATTDTTWQAVAVTAGGSLTTVSTVVAIDTNPHTFEMTTTGTVVTYFIDHNQVAQISTNVPSGLLGGNSFAEMFWTGDNKNTANAVSGTHYWMALSPK